VGDRVEVHFDPNNKYTRVKKPRRTHGFEVLFEDEHVVVVNKPAQCLTVPTSNRETNTLIGRVASYLAKGRRRTAIRAVQRLDRGVSGVLVFAKSELAYVGLRRQFECHQPEREYLAIVAGRLTTAEGTFRGLMMTDKSLRRRTSRRSKTGELAITHYRRERIIGNTTLVRVRLETGRRNQIRVHFADAGHPVLGDRRYQPARAKHPRWRSNRLALHALSLEFHHPQTREQLRFEAPVPDAFKRFLKSK
jgi:23S rRNA pseudouridine1911/1915/1917 synthase